MQSTYNGSFFLIHAVNTQYFQRDRTQNQQELHVKLLIDPRNIDPKFFNTNDTSQHVLSIYPPWKKIQIKDTNHNVYFNINLIEIEANKFHKANHSSVYISNFTSLKCPQCIISPHESSKCSLNLLNIKQFVQAIKLSNSTDSDKGDEAQSQLFSSNNQNLLFTQTQNNLPTQALTQSRNVITANNDSPLMTETQYMNENSILHALANVGYSGFVSFKATVQRVGLMKWSFTSFGAFNSQTTQARTQYSQNCQYKYVLFISSLDIVQRI